MSGYDDDLERIVAELNRAAPGGRPAIERPAAHGQSVDDLLALAVRRGASDILLVAGAPVSLRIHGALVSSGQPLSAEEVRALLTPLIDAGRLNELREKRSLDFGFQRDGAVRFRANIHYQRGTLAGSLRLLPARIPSLESLRLPSHLAKLIERRQGLVLVTGPTGCGKSSTLAALIDLVNARRRDHIVTIEDPIEFHHASRGAVIEQIEIGQDAPHFAGCLRNVLRQSPDVILVGEMRDLETMSTVLTAAETGHLVLSALHTNSAAQTVARILDSFPAAQQAQIRQQLSLTLLAVIAQQLVPACDGTGRYPAVEIMMGTDAVRNLIRKGEDHQLHTQISISRAEGMITMEQSLVELVRQGRIQRETAFAHCFRPGDLERYFAA